MPALNPAYLKPKAIATVAILAYLVSYRPLLEKHNLIDGYHGVAYPPLPQGKTCEGRNKAYRTLDGTCNDLELPMAGSVNMRFGRNMPGLVTDEKLLLYPNPRVISQRILKRKEPIEAKGLNLLVSSWIQFQTHDWVFHDMTDRENAIRVPLPEGDPMLVNGATHMIIPRTRPDNAIPGEAKDAARSHKNLNTAWWDLSQVYGSNEEDNRNLRTLQDGLLKHDAGKDWIPVDPKTGQEYAGFKENWWTGLAMWHNIWVKEHNHIATMIKKEHPERFKGMSPQEMDQELHDLARLVTSCINAKVHTVEWTEAVLNNQALHTGMDANWYGITGSTMVQDIMHKLPVVGSNAVLAGLVGGKQHNDGVPFSLTEEFASVYRMHSLLPDEMRLQTCRKPGTVVKKMLRDVTFRNSSKLVDEGQFKPVDLYYSFGRQPPTALTVRNYPEFLTNFFKPGEDTLMDVATRDIVRERERGVPRYNEFRRQMHLTPVENFDDLTPDKEVADELRAIYNNDIEKLDMYVGCLAENPRPENFGFGETAFSIFILMASRRLKTDRFLNEYYNAEHYTKWGFDYTRKMGMKEIIARQYPQLAPKFQDKKYVFFEWDA